MKVRFQVHILLLKGINYAFLVLATLIGTIAHFDSEEFYIQFPPENNFGPGDTKQPDDAYLWESIFVYFTITTLMTLTMNLVYVHTSPDDNSQSLNVIDIICHGIGSILLFLAGCLIFASVSEVDQAYFSADGSKTEAQRNVRARFRKLGYMFGEKIVSGLFCYVSSALCLFLVMGLICSGVFLRREQNKNTLAQATPSRTNAEGTTGSLTLPHNQPVEGENPAPVASTKSLAG